MARLARFAKAFKGGETATWSRGIRTARGRASSSRGFSGVPRSRQIDRSWRRCAARSPRGPWRDRCLWTQRGPGWPAPPDAGLWPRDYRPPLRDKRPHAAAPRPVRSRSIRASGGGLPAGRPQTRRADEKRRTVSAGHRRERRQRRQSFFPAARSRIRRSRSISKVIGAVAPCGQDRGLLHRRFRTGIGRWRCSPPYMDATNTPSVISISWGVGENRWSQFAARNVHERCRIARRGANLA